MNSILMHISSSPFQLHLKMRVRVHKFIQYKLKINEYVQNYISETAVLRKNMLINFNS